GGQLPPRAPFRDFPPFRLRVLEHANNPAAAPANLQWRLCRSAASARAAVSKKHWVVWKWCRNGKDKWTKPPLYAPEPVHRAANNRPDTWSVHRAAVKAVLGGRANGIGFVLTDTDVAAVDIDKCRDPETGAIDSWAQQILDAAPNSYREITVSGTGLRIIGTAKGTETHRRFSVAGREGAGIEV